MVSSCHEVGYMAEIFKKFFTQCIQIRSATEQKILLEHKLNFKYYYYSHFQLLAYKCQIKQPATILKYIYNIHQQTDCLLSHTCIMKYLIGWLFFFKYKLLKGSNS